MKNVFIIPFLIVYLVLSVGMDILIHTCAGESDATLVTTKAEDPCSCGDEMPAEDMCCKTELKTVKVDDVQTVTPVTIEQNLVLIGTLTPIEVSTFDIRHSSFVIPSDTSPPPDKDLHISNSVFLI